MPYFDGTGPRGFGPMTGRGLGFCGRGRGRGFGRRYAPVAEPVAFTKEEQRKILEAELAELEAEKKAIEKELKGLK